MRFLLQVLLTAVWALWLGGTAALFVFAPYLFHRFGTESETARNAANALFIVFGRYELCLAAAAVLTAGMLLINFGNRWMPLVLLTLIFAGGIAVTTTLGFTPLMESLRAQGKASGPAFQRLHAKSVAAMTVQLGVLLVAGGLLLKSVSASRAAAADRLAAPAE